jgi:hypothetical protein
MLRGNLVAYGSIGDQTFYVQAPTLEGLDTKLVETISKLCKKTLSNSC